MKKTISITAFAMLTLAGCSDNKLPSECVDMMEFAEKISKELGAPMGQQEDMMKMLETQWESMSDDEKEKARKECIQTKTMLDSMKNLGN